MGAVHICQVRPFYILAKCSYMIVDVGKNVVNIYAFRYHGIEVKDFGPSWRDGVAFQSVVHAIRPDLVDMEVVRRRSNRENLEEAFTLAENELGIPRLLDPEGAPDLSCGLHLILQCIRLFIQMGDEEE